MQGTARVTFQATVEPFCAESVTLQCMVVMCDLDGQFGTRISIFSIASSAHWLHVGCSFDIESRTQLYVRSASLQLTGGG